MYGAPRNKVFGHRSLRKCRPIDRHSRSRPEPTQRREGSRFEQAGLMMRIALGGKQPGC
jgi:hypothetical protein